MAGENDGGTQNAAQQQVAGQADAQQQQQAGQTQQANTGVGKRVKIDVDGRRKNEKQQSGTTGPEPVGVSGKDDSMLKRWERIAGLEYDHAVWCDSPVNYGA